MARRLPALFALLLPGPLLAGEVVQLDPAVISGSRSAERSFDLPFSVDSLDRRTISEGQPGINASEVLQRVPGRLWPCLTP